jgi:hypothetical protein
MGRKMVAAATAGSTRGRGRLLDTNISRREVDRYEVARVCTVVAGEGQRMDEEGMWSLWRLKEKVAPSLFIPPSSPVKGGA